MSEARILRLGSCSPVPQKYGAWAGQIEVGPSPRAAGDSAEFGAFLPCPLPRPPHVTVAVSQAVSPGRPRSQPPVGLIDIELPLALNKHFPAIFT